VTSILIYHTCILLQRLEIAMLGILLHLNDIGAMCQMVGDMDRSQVVNVTPRDTRKAGDSLEHLLHCPIGERLARPTEEDTSDLTLWSDFQVGTDAPTALLCRDGL
jgi:hypothetical protein